MGKSLLYAKPFLREIILHSGYNLSNSRVREMRIIKSVKTDHSHSFLGALVTHGARAVV